jgi:hypothetical protein
MGPNAVAAILGSEPWRECGTRHHFAERPKSTPRYAGISTGVATGATSLTEAMTAWRQRAGQPQAGQGRKPAEPGARSASLCVGHVRQLGGESPLCNLMEVKH